MHDTTQKLLPMKHEKSKSLGRTNLLNYHKLRNVGTAKFNKFNFGHIQVDIIIDNHSFTPLQKVNSTVKYTEIFPEIL